MTNKRAYTLIGGFLLGAIVLLVAGVLTFSNVGIFHSNRKAVIYFDQSILGLTRGSHVLFRGMQVGTVRNVRLQVGDGERGHARVAVTVEMSGNDVVMPDGRKMAGDIGIHELVERGLRAKLVVYSFVTSELAVDLDFHPDKDIHYKTSPDQREWPEIPSLPSDMDEIRRKITEMPWEKSMKQANKTMKAVTHLAEHMDGLADRLGPGLEKTNETTRQTLEAVQQAIQTNNQQLKSTLASVQKLSDSANGQIAKHDQQLDKILADTQKTSQSLRRLSRNLDDMTDPDSATRQDLNSTLRDLSATTSSLRKFTEKIERNPNAMLYGNSR